MKWVKQKNFILFDQNQNPVAFSGVITDITPLKENNEIIRNQGKYEQIYENMSDVVWTRDIKTGFFNYMRHTTFEIELLNPDIKKN